MLTRDLATFPAGLETTVGTRGVTLSGGQVQRIAVARMLVREAELFVLDDVSSALDLETERALWRSLPGPDRRNLLAVRTAARAAGGGSGIVLRDGRVMPAVVWTGCSRRTRDARPLGCAGRARRVAGDTDRVVLRRGNTGHVAGKVERVTTRRPQRRPPDGIPSGGRVVCWDSVGFWDQEAWDIGRVTMPSWKA